MATAPRFSPWTPYEVPLPPAGSYDPALDAQNGAVQRGLGDTIFDTNLLNARNLTDYGIGSAQLGQQRDRAMQDLGFQQQDYQTGFDRQSQDLSYQGQQGQRSFDRQMADLGLSSDRLTQDFNTNVGLLTRKYQQLGRDQLQGANARGVIGGTALLQAAAKRAANQGIEQNALQTSYDRGQQDIGTAKTRAGEDWTSQRGQIDLAKQRLGQDYTTQNQRFGIQGDRIGQDYAYNQGQLDLGYGRQQQDSGINLLRAQREAGAYNLDTQAQQYGQAAANGWMPPERPANEFGSGSSAHRVIQRGNFDYVIDPSGKVISKRRRAA